MLQRGGLAPLHIACSIPGEEGVKITELLLDALADPDIRATQDDSFLNRNLVSASSRHALIFHCLSAGGRLEP
jgi:hypothetical protein